MYLTTSARDRPHTTANIFTVGRTTAQSHAQLITSGALLGGVHIPTIAHGIDRNQLTSLKLHSAKIFSMEFPIERDDGAATTVTHSLFPCKKPKGKGFPGRLPCYS